MKIHDIKKDEFAKREKETGFSFPKEEEEQLEKDAERLGITKLQMAEEINWQGATLYNLTKRYNPNDPTAYTMRCPFTKFNFTFEVIDDEEGQVMIMDTNILVLFRKHLMIGNMGQDAFDNGLAIMHRDGNPNNLDPENLYFGPNRPATMTVDNVAKKKGFWELIKDRRYREVTLFSNKLMKELEEIDAEEWMTIRNSGVFASKEEEISPEEIKKKEAEWKIRQACNPDMNPWKDS